MSISIKTRSISKPLRFVLSAGVLAAAVYFCLYGLGLADPLF